ncbi:MAG: 2-amino-4-hydroxy-6-hydroxymethyldihydropteridine diphosphokinase [Alphaproteobacteria bacterium]
MILIGFGANLDGKYGSPEASLRECASQFVNHGLNITASSFIWASAPVPISDQPWYKNAVCAVETTLNPHEVLKALNALEHKAGRVRTAQNAARVLDLDLLAYNDTYLNDDILKIPHPQMHNRAFVLYPLREIAPHWSHPITNMTVDKMVDSLPEGQEIKRIEGGEIYPVPVDSIEKATI